MRRRNNVAAVRATFTLVGLRPGESTFIDVERNRELESERERERRINLILTATPVKGRRQNKKERERTRGKGKRKSYQTPPLTTHRLTRSCSRSWQIRDLLCTSVWSTNANRQVECLYRVRPRTKLSHAKTRINVSPFAVTRHIAFN